MTKPQPKPNDERYSPKWVIDCVHRSLGLGWLDPCPIGGTNGLVGDWRSHGVYVNPPSSLMREFVEKFSGQYLAGNFQRGIWCYFHWQHNTSWWARLHRLNPTYGMCRKRVRFLDPEGKLVDVGRSQAFGFFGEFSERELDCWREHVRFMRAV